VTTSQEWHYSLYVHNPLTVPVTVVAELGTVASDGGNVQAAFAILPGSRTVEARDVGEFSLSLAAGWRPEGVYTTTFTFHADNADIAPATGQFVLQVAQWPAALEWAQQRFVYEVDAVHREAFVWATARYADAAGIQAELSALKAGESTTVTFGSAGFLSLQAPTEMAQDALVPLTLSFTPTLLPAPGTYSGTLRLRASNAAPIEAPFTLIVPDSELPDRTQGAYRLGVAELGQTSDLTTTVALTTALQFDGVRLLPGSTGAGDWWPITVGVLLLVAGLAALVWYTRWSGYTGVWWWILVGVAAIACVAAVWWALSNPPADLIQAKVGPRNLLIWEATGRGPVQDIAILPGEVADQVGHTGEIVVGHHGSEIPTGRVLTAPLTVTQLSRPGVYQGRVLIQSPHIAGGVVEVPVQVTVHDLLLWPGLVILLGVILGGWVKYLQGIISKCLEKRKEIEEAWGKWDDYMLRDPYLYANPGDRKVVGPLNPIYTVVRREFDRSLELLDKDAEWGISDAEQSKKRVEELWVTYRQLSETVSYWRDELASGTGARLSEKRDSDKPSSADGRPASDGQLAASEPGEGDRPTTDTDQPDMAELRRLVDEAENALRRGDLQEATALTSRLVRNALPAAIEGLLALVGEPKEEEKEKKEIKTLLAAAQALCRKGHYDGAWLQFLEAEYRLRALGETVPRIGLLAARVKELRLVKAVAEEIEEHYEIRPLFAGVRYRVEETIPLGVVLVGADGQIEPLPADVAWDWSVNVYEGKGKAKSSSYTIQVQEPRTRATIVFHERGRWKVEARGSGGTAGEKSTSISLDIRESGILAIYREKRRHNFNRQLAALLLALVGGIAAQKVFGLTFGSFEEYLGAFAWGIAAGVGAEPAVNAYDQLRTTAGTLLSKLAGTPQGSGSNPPGQ
jgi:hypothetical protein